MPLIIGHGIRQVTTLSRALWPFIAGALIAATVAAQPIVIDTGGVVFSVAAPTGWRRETPSTPNSRVRFISPAKTPYAECAVIVQDMPALRGHTQKEFDLEIATQTDARELEQQLATQYKSPTVQAIAMRAVAGFPAQEVRYLAETKSAGRPIWTNSITRTWMTTPSYIWTLVCGGQGSDRMQAGNALDYWLHEISSFPLGFKILRK